MMMNLILGIVAGMFYVPSIAYAIWKGRSWVDILVVGIILMILATGLNGFLPPWGTVGFVVVHLILTGLGIRGVVMARQTRTSEKIGVEPGGGG